MTIKEIEAKLKELADIEKTIKSEIDNMKIALTEAISKEKAKVQIPNDVRDIPTKLSFDDFKVSDIRQYHTAYYIDENIRVQSKYLDYYAFCESDDYDLTQHSLFVEYKDCEMICAKIQLLLHCWYFKYKYDYDYQPNWNIEFKAKNHVSFSYGENMFVRDVTFGFDVNAVYFSDKIIAEKCADWLNFIYKRGKYTNGY